MEFLTNDIVKFRDSGNELNGIIKAVLDKIYYIHGLDGKEYKIDKINIVESIGKTKVNETRAKAEEWQKTK